MKIRIPNNFLGKPIAGSMERALAIPQTKKDSEHSIVPRGNVPDLNGFEYVPSIGIYVSKTKELHGKNWSDCTQELHANNKRMLSPYEFVEFINHLRGKNDPESTTILDDIYKVEGNWRSEWLGAKFEVQGSSVKMQYEVFSPTGIIEKVQDLTGILMQDKTPGIAMNEWLSNNQYGLPKSNTSDGELYYWHPRNGAVAGFGADSGWAYLVCNGNPSFSNPQLGVRAALAAPSA